MATSYSMFSPYRIIPEGRLLEAMASAVSIGLVNLGLSRRALRQAA